MMKKFIIALAATATLMTLSACSSGDTQGDEEVIAEEGMSEELEGLGAEAGDASMDDGSMVIDENQLAETTPDADSSVAETISEDQLSLDSFGEGSTDVAATDVPDTSSMVEPAVLRRPDRIRRNRYGND